MNNLEKLYNEKWRPRFHYSTKNSWLNDPNGLVYFNGTYHLYYQTVPGSCENTGDLHWGHAVSSDLVHWKECPPALYPDSLGTMWSGTGVVDKTNSSGFFNDTKQGIVVAYSTDNQNIGIAYSDDGYKFTKISETTPVIAHPDGVKDFRDPHIFWYPEDNKWKMVIAGGYLRIYESTDLVHWSPCGNAQEEYNTECPNLLRMKVQNSNEEKWVLSLGGRDYMVGSYDGKKFSHETEKIIMNEGADTYAGITFSNMPDNRCVMISWFNRWWYAKNTPDGIWNGCLTLPIEMKLIKTKDSYRLIQTPVKEVENLRDKIIFSECEKVYKAGTNPLKDVFADTYEMLVTIDINKTPSFKLGLHIGDGDNSFIHFSKETMVFTFDRSECKEGSSELKNKFNPREFVVSKEAVCDGKLSLRIFVDRSNVEMFISSGYYYFTSRIQPSINSNGMYLISDNELGIDELKIYTLKSIWD